MVANETTQTLTVDNVTSLIGQAAGFIKTQLLTPLIQLSIVFVVVYLFLRIVRSILLRLQKRDLVSSTLAEQIYRLVSLVTYTVTIITLIYMFTSAREVIYVLIVALAAILLANWSIIADISAYYIMLAFRQTHRAATLIELPRLGIKGKIIGTGLFHTRIRTLSGKIVYIPNHVMLSEPVAQLANVQSTVALEVELNIPKVEKGNPIEQLERNIKSILGEARLATRPQDITILVLSADNNRVKLEIHVPVMGAEPRPATINNIISTLMDELEELSPSIRLKQLV
ncbi:mechanosensitive ion channel family protein [Pyrodictium delaneyi]|uniref:mechanosensitive ion channel family protein n=1 Tax=Pyrodictium delaneyi TaxID=1273541 RepID=UPI0006DBE4BA|nr:mechanosensitive ion channel family protein [Pyrodictium delaneyi]